jgi:hypothetical protein
VVGHLQPRLKLNVEISRRVEPAAGQEGPFQILVQSFDDPLGLRIAGFADDHFRAQHTAEGMAGSG